jgi:hypothetical protein
MADPSYIVDGVLTDGEAWVGITTTTLGSDTATITFTSTDNGQVGDFSQYMDLIVIAYARTTQAVVTGYMGVNCNNSTGNRHWVQWFYADGSSPAGSANVGTSQPAALGVANGASAGANEFSATVFNWYDINSGKYKSMSSQSGADSNGDGTVLMNTAVWKSQAPITEIDIAVAGNDFVTGSVFSLFGVLPRMVT